MKHLIAALAALAIGSCDREPLRNVAELGDDDPSTACAVPAGEPFRVLFDGFEAPMRNYEVFSSGGAPASDPAGWVLCGSHDGRRWVELDRREGASFCSRFQPLAGRIAQPSDYAAYRLEFFPQSGADTVAVGEVRFRDRDREAGWSAFVCPEVRFEVLSPETEGAAIYARLVQRPDDYIRHHARKVAEELFYSAADTMNAVGRIDYTLSDYEGVSAKSGTPAATSIVYSTRHIERSAVESLAKLDYETRGVLFHELVHAYQFEPRGIGTYSTNREFWACIEGLADAVRAQAGYFDAEALRRPGGHWLDGYRTTGFFLQWLTTLRPDALREFHVTVRDLEPWSFDGAMRAMFGPERGIERMWAEYQEFLAAEQAGAERQMQAERQAGAQAEQRAQAAGR